MSSFFLFRFFLWLPFVLSVLLNESQQSGVFNYLCRQKGFFLCWFLFHDPMYEWMRMFCHCLSSSRVLYALHMNHFAMNYWILIWNFSFKCFPPLGPNLMCHLVHCACALFWAAQKHLRKLCVTENCVKTGKWGHACFACEKRAWARERDGEEEEQTNYLLTLVSFELLVVVWLSFPLFVLGGSWFRHFIRNDTPV